MATSGSTSVTVTSWNTLKFSWERTNYSINNNTSTIGWKLELIAGSSGYISTSASKSWSVIVNGTKYSGTNTVGISNNSTKTLASGTTTISHNADGTKSFSYSFSQQFSITFSGSSIGTISGSGSGTLNTIPRKSSLTASNGTLGTAQTLTVTRHSSSFTHTITYECGSYTGTICTKSSSTSISFTPYWSFASQNTTGTTVSVVFTITTYNGNTSLGSNTTTITCSIPESVKPSCTISVTDAEGYFDTYGAYIKGQSKFKVTVTPTLSYGSAIASYSTTANGVKYTSASFTTGVLTSSGTRTITATVTDQRRRNGTATKDVEVYNYSVPQIPLLKVKRCVSLTDGTEDINGEFCQVTFSTSITALNNLNSATYKLEYKKTSDDEYTSVNLTDFNNVYKVTEATYIFPADSGSSYNVRIVATDNFDDVSKPTLLSTGEVMEHWRADGKGMGFGKIGEVVNGADFGWAIKPNGGFINIPLEENTDVDDVIIPNTYVGYNEAAHTYKNLPAEMTGGTFTLVVESGGNEGQVKQTLTRTSKTDLRIWIRHYHSTNGVFSWGDWVCVYSYGNNQIEHGTSGGWSYKKWDDGTAECWAEISGTGTAIGINTMVISFPLYFLEGKFIVNATPARNATQVSWYGECNGAGNLQRGCGYCYFSYRLTSEHIPTFNICVKGRWK